VQLHARDAEDPVDRTRVHVDELHAPVGDDDDAPEQDAAAHEQVVLPLGVAPCARLPAGEPEGPDGQTGEDDRGRPQR
jgi:hypothetical protein